MSCTRPGQAAPESPLQRGNASACRLAPVSILIMVAVFLSLFSAPHRALGQELAQPRASLAGSVKDTNGQHIPEVSVRIPLFGRSVITGLDGGFHL